MKHRTPFGILLLVVAWPIPQVTAQSPVEYLWSVPVVSVPRTVVPEPSTVLMVATGLLMLGFVAWLRRKDDE